MKLLCRTMNASDRFYTKYIYDCNTADMETSAVKYNALLLM